MKLLIAKLVSFIFHPLFFAIIIPFLVVYHSTTNFDYGIKWTLYSLVFIFATLIVLFLIRPSEFFSDFDISKREKRPLFYSVSLIFSVVYFILAVYIKGIFFPLTLVSLGIIVGLVAFEIGNMFLKISIHAAIACAFTITYGLLYGPIAFLFVFWIPFLVAWSRWVLRKHTLIEIISGGILGCVITLITFAIEQLIR